MEEINDKFMPPGTTEFTQEMGLPMAAVRVDNPSLKDGEYGGRRDKIYKEIEEMEKMTEEGTPKLKRESSKWSRVGCKKKRFSTRWPGNAPGLVQR